MDNFEPEDGSDNVWPDPLLTGRKRVFPYASHFAFCLCGDPSAFPEMEMERLEAGERLFASTGQIRILTDSYACVPVDVELRSGPPPKLDDYPWDEILEISINVKQALTVEGGVDGTYLTLPITGTHIVRLHVLRAEEPNDLDHAGDFYLIQLWPGSPIEKRILR